MAPRAFSARLSTPRSPPLRACSSAASSHRSPSAWRPRRACAVPYSSARAGEPSRSLASRAPRHAMTSVWRPAAASCWALSTRIDDVCMVCVSRVPCALPRNRVLREVVHIGRDVFLGRVVLRRHLEPAVYLRGLLREGELPLEHLIGGIHDPVAVQIRVRVHIPDDEARREHVGEHHSGWLEVHGEVERDRKSTRLNSSHGYISYAVFCLKKKKQPTPSPSSIRERYRTTGRDTSA